LFLSGYLITSIIRAARRESAFWQEFWTKRVTRILPPVIFLMLLADGPYKIEVFLYSQGPGNSENLIAGMQID
jgi:hypothetical protein